jgi:hypothetical protein
MLAWSTIDEAHVSEGSISDHQDKPIIEQLYNPNRNLVDQRYISDITSTSEFAVYLPIVSRALPPISLFLGSWTNENPDTGGVTRVEIRTESNTVYVHMWGKCHPTDCDWGETTTDISDANDGILSLTWVFYFKVETQQLSVLPDGRLQVTGHVHYTDDSGRQDRDYTEYYLKQ